jgi:hypothetical protein
MSTAGSRIEREFILKALVEKAAPMQLRYRNHWIPCTLKEVSSEDLILQLSGNLQEPLRAEEKVDVFFKFRGARMTFRTKILAFDTENSTLLPPGIYRTFPGIRSCNSSGRCAHLVPCQGNGLS